MNYLRSKKLADGVLQPFQKLSSRPRTLSCSSAADSACKGFDLSEAVGFGRAAANDVAKRMVVRTIRRDRSPRGPARTPTVRFVD
jgi:hypothetical protein